MQNMHSPEREQDQNKKRWTWSNVYKTSWFDLLKSSQARAKTSHVYRTDVEDLENPIDESMRYHDGQTKPRHRPIPRQSTRFAMVSNGTFVNLFTLEFLRALDSISQPLKSDSDSLDTGPFAKAQVHRIEQYDSSQQYRVNAESRDTIAQAEHRPNYHDKVLSKSDHADANNVLEQQEKAQHLASIVAAQLGPLDPIRNPAPTSPWAVLTGDHALRVFLAGGIAGAISRSITAPFDRLKIHLITLTKTGTLEEQKAQVGLRKAIVRIYRKGGGVKAFWIGNGLNIVKIFPESAIKFLSYETAKRLCARHIDGVADQRDISGVSRFCSGGVGGLVSQLSIYPIETLKTRMMSSENNNAIKRRRLLMNVARDLYSKGGFRAFYRGLPASLMGVFPFAAIDLSSFEAMKAAYMRAKSQDHVETSATLAMGALSGSIGASCVYPLNLVRTRLQAAGTPAHPRVYSSIRDCFVQTYRADGIRGFYKGLLPTLLKVAPAISISYLVYDRTKRMMHI